MLPTKFESVGYPGQEKRRKIDFKDGGHLGFPFARIIAILVYKEKVREKSGECHDHKPQPFPEEETDKTKRHPMLPI